MIRSKAGVRWDDLVRYRPWEVVKELLLPLPWLALSLFSSHHGNYILACLGAFYFFLTSLRLSHNAFHYSLGLPRWLTDIVMLVQSVLMLGALHAVQYTHLQHHRHCLSDEDIEGRVARQGFWEVLCKGPLFPFAIHACALRRARGRKRAWIYGELALNFMLVVSVFTLVDVFALQFHILLMMAGYGMSAFFAVWLVHRRCPATGHPARTLRGRVRNLLFYNMFLHLEHHLFPAVPTCRWPQLARRLDQAGVRAYESVF